MRLLAGAATAVLIGSAAAGPPEAARPTITSAGQVARLRALADVETVHPGESFHLVVLVSLRDHWHVYWRNPGASGAPTELATTAPEGYRVGPVRMPRPRAFDGPEGVSYGYEHEAAFFIPVTAPATLGDGSAAFRIDASYLVCLGYCLLGQDRLDLQVDTRSAPRRATPAGLAATAEGKLIARHRDRLPRPLSALRGATAVSDGTVLRIEGPAPHPGMPILFPDPGPGVTLGTAVSTTDAGRFRIEVPLEVKPRNALGRPLACSGIVAFGSRPDDPCFEFTLPLAVADTAPGDPAP